VNSEIIPFKEPRALAGLAAKLPAVFLPDRKAAERFFGFFTADHQNRNPQRSYYKAARCLADWPRPARWPIMLTSAPRSFATGAALLPPSVSSTSWGFEYGRS